MLTQQIDTPDGRPAALFLGIIASLALFVLAVVVAAPDGTELLHVTTALAQGAEDARTGWALTNALAFAALLGTGQALAAFVLASLLPRSAHTVLATGFLLPVALLLVLGVALEFQETIQNDLARYYRPLVLIVICGMSFLVPAMAAAIASRIRQP